MSYSVPDYAINRPRTRIVCTLGPASSSEGVILELIRAGMSVARLNLSHADHATHSAAVAAVRNASKTEGVPVAILADLPGPKHRLGHMTHEGVVLNPGQRYVLRDGAEKSDSQVGYVHPAGFVASVVKGAKVYIADGALQMVVDDVRDGEVECIVTVGGPLLGYKAVSSPGRASHIDYLTDETAAALEFAAQEAVDFVGISYIRSAEDVQIVRRYFEERDFYPQLIAKIELAEAMEHLEEIIDASDGVMVARGDLGVEMPVASVPGSQKRIIRIANTVGKVVITATQMLESMIHNPAPTRAEVTDVANAVIDGTDAVMLSAETSIGTYPVVSTTTMAEVAREAEKSLDTEIIAARRRTSIKAVDEAIAEAACRTADTVGAKLILAFTESGSTAARVAAFRPRMPVIAMAREPAAGRALSMRWGVIVVDAPWAPGISQMFREGSRAALEIGLAEEEDRAVAVMGVPIGLRGHTNLLRVITLPEPERTAHEPEDVPGTAAPQHALSGSGEDGDDSG
ncbi:MAG: pyruvate kinase [Chloroflexota bacterium]